MRYIVALDFDYFDNDFWFGDLNENPLIPDMHKDALSEGYIRLFDDYDEASSFAREVIERICNRADTDGNEHKETFISRLRNEFLADILLMSGNGAHGTFDAEECYGNWGIRIRLLRRGTHDGTWERPDYCY